MKRGGRGERGEPNQTGLILQYVVLLAKHIQELRLLRVMGHFQLCFFCNILQARHTNLEPDFVTCHKRRRPLSYCLAGTTAGRGFKPDKEEIHVLSVCLSVSFLWGCEGVGYYFSNLKTLSKQISQKPILLPLLATFSVLFFSVTDFTATWHKII